MPEIQNPKPGYDLEERTFSRRVGIKLFGFSLNIAKNICE